MSAKVISFFRLLRNEAKVSRTHVSFHVQPFEPSRWVIAARQDDGTLITLAGVYNSKEAAERRLPFVSRQWQGTASLPDAKGVERFSDTLHRAGTRFDHRVVDPLAVAIDWLDAYRARDIERIVAFYAEHAYLRCACGPGTTGRGRRDLRRYWEERVTDHPAGQLMDLELTADGTVLSYSADNGIVEVSLQIDGDGRIVTHLCGPQQAS